MDLKIDHTTMENAVAFPINFDANFPGIWLGKLLFLEYKSGIPTAALPFFVVTEFCFPSVREDNFLYSHTPNWGERNEKEQKGNLKKREREEKSPPITITFLQVQCYSTTAKWLTGNRQWSSTCMFKEAFRCFQNQSIKEKTLLLSPLLPTQSLEIPCIKKRFYTELGKSGWVG